MSVARVSELITASPKSFEDAIQIGVARAVMTLKNVEGVWVANQKCVIKGEKVAEYRVNLKATLFSTTEAKYVTCSPDLLLDLFPFIMETATATRGKHHG
jgi:flavin-binding protein dodecin